jgi:2-polyprenyl-3-methyl-5-hydroxy-6-metoxy-1,4-benzoquinol methylase
MTEHWNHNVHYEPVILDAVPAGCGSALDVGCGDGLLATRLASRCAAVTGIDQDARMIAIARQRVPAAGAGTVTFVAADFRTHTDPGRGVSGLSETAR